jgi:hypothetical protein
MNLPGRLVGALACRGGFDARGVGAALLGKVAAAEVLLSEFLRLSLLFKLPKIPVLRSMMDDVECVGLQKCVVEVLMANDMTVP